MSNQTLSNIECGKSDFRIGTLKVIEEVWQCTLILIQNEDLISRKKVIKYFADSRNIVTFALSIQTNG